MGKMDMKISNDFGYEKIRHPKKGSFLNRHLLVFGYLRIKKVRINSL
jgi:hypothetical protein